MKQLKKEHYDLIKQASSEIYDSISKMASHVATKIALDEGYSGERRAEILDIILMNVSSETLGRGIAYRTNNEVIVDYSQNKTKEEWDKQLISERLEITIR